jgi:hypothetical protein
MDRTACTEPQCLYKGAHYLYLTVELYLYSPYGPYGLYRASVPIQGCTLPLPYSRAIPLLSLWAVRLVQSLSAYTRVHFTSRHGQLQPHSLRFFTHLSVIGKRVFWTADPVTMRIERRPKYGDCEDNLFSCMLCTKLVLLCYWFVGICVWVVAFSLVTNLIVR